MPIDWTIWARCEALPLHQAAALLAGIDPEKVNAQPPYVRASSHALSVEAAYRSAGIPRQKSAPNAPASYGEFYLRRVDEAAAMNRSIRGVLLVAKSAVASGSLKPLASGQFALRDFVTWASDKGFTIPPELQAFAKPRDYSELTEREQASVTRQLFDQYETWRRDSDTRELNESLKALVGHLAADRLPSIATQNASNQPQDKEPLRELRGWKEAVACLERASGRKSIDERTARDWLNAAKVAHARKHGRCVFNEDDVERVGRDHRL